MSDLPLYLDIRASKNFTEKEGYWYDTISTWMGRFKEEGKKKITFLINDEAKENFIQFLDNHNIKFEYSGFVSEFYKDMPTVPMPISGQMYTIFI
ncbi:hypothetical protein CEE44_00670 [Candidatus Woesearchaeota archaeon B3_Woes]|nr:MAG: hypothetical protein CEE44_00670 [Candidatus Woesearchaeota archaeon B3_Woes]